MGIKFQYTRRDIPQYNGRVATIWSFTRIATNAAKLPKWMRDGMWAEAVNHSKDVKNALVKKIERRRILTPLLKNSTIDLGKA